MQPSMFEKIGAFMLAMFDRPRLLALIAVGILLISFAAFAGPARAQQSCPNGTSEALVAQLKAEEPNAEVVLYTGPEAQKVITQYNAAPPVSALIGDAVTVAIHPVSPIMVVIIERKGCVVEAGLFPVNAMRLPAASRGKGV